MGLTGKQKKLIKKRIKKVRLGQVAEELGVDSGEVRRYLIRLWGKDKYGRVVKEEKKEQAFSFRSWVKENKGSLIFLAVLGLIIYINAWGAEFVSDDIFGIVNNQYLGDLKRALRSPLTVSRPLYYWFIFNIFGKVPAAFRSINIVSHVLMVMAVYLLVYLLVEKRTALLAGVLTAVHPILAESVVWISGGGHSQYAVLVVVSFIFYILAGKERKYYIWSVISFFLALEFSEKAASFPGILLLYQILFDRKRKWWELLPFFGLSSVWVWANVRKVPARLGYLEADFATDVSKMNPWLQVPVAITSYLGLIFWPDKLTLYHSELRVTVVEFWTKVALTGMVVGVGLVSFWQGLKDKQWAKQVCFWLGFFVIALSPTLLPLGVSWVVAERYAYLGAVGILVLIAYGVSQLSKRRGWYEVVMVVFGIVVIGLMVRTVVRNNDWRTADSLWLSAVRTSPNSPQNNNNLGDYYGRQGDLEQAAWHFQRAAELRPGYADPIHNLGNIYLKMGRVEEAFKAYHVALELKPKLWQSHQALAGIYYNQRNFEKTIEELEKAVRINPDDQSLQQLLLKIRAQQAAEEK